jgi:beta-lactamase regulating signal transducer with metallopeptidase domain/thiol-disulfide isomerase/thioredoxin
MRQMPGAGAEPIATPPLLREPPARLVAPPASVASVIAPHREKRGPEAIIPAARAGLGRWLLAAWLAGGMILAGRLVISARRLAQIVARSRCAPEWAVAEFEAIAARLGGGRGVRVAVSDELRTPCLAGVQRPVILLPAGSLRDGEPADLRAILAHELAHVRGRDVIWNDALHVASILLWFHPLAWRIRAAHAVACDSVCDAVAADLLGDVPSYSRTLARLALQVAGPAPAHGLAMARTSDVRRRIESLHRKLFRAPLPRRLAMPALLLVGLVVVLVGGLGFSFTEPAPAQTPAAPRPEQEPAKSDAPGRMTVRVTDARTGRPLEGVEVDYRIYTDKTKREKPLTGADGTAVIEHAPDASVVSFTLTVRKPKYVPAHVYLDGRKHPLTLPASKTFALEPGTTIGGVVRDESGRPIEGATVSITMEPAESDSSNYVFHIGTPKTDAQGRWRIDEAPANLGSVGIRIEHPKYRVGYAKPSRDLDSVAVLTRGLTVRGRVTDAKTGQPISKFRLIDGLQFEGRDRIFWQTNEAITYTAGEYRRSFDEPAAAYFLRIEAPGYAPAQSRPFRSDEGEQSFDFALKPAEGLSGVVVLPDGRPAAGASVALATREARISLRAGAFDRNAVAPIVQADADGRFTFPPQDDKFLLVAVSDAGFADASSDEFAKSGKLVLQPWGRIEGRVRIGRNPGADQEVSFHPIRPNRGGGLYVFDYGYTTRTDADGRFTFDRVIPGPGTVSRMIVTEFPGGSSQHMPGWPASVDVAPGATSVATIGGQGRPVVGRVVLSETPEVPIDWRQNEPAQIHAPRSELARNPNVWPRFAGHIDKDGRFRIDDVPPGRYELEVPVNAPPDPRFCGAGTAIGRANLELDVPEGPDDVPFDLGDIEAKLLPTLKAGDFAPNFTARTLDGQPFKLSDRQGKLVLLDFWATWCGPCLAEMPNVKNLRAVFAADPRFEIVGLSCDQDIEPPARYAKENDLAWTQVFVGGLGGGITESYHVRAIPATFLIGPDGRILARNLRGPALEEAVRKALKDDSLFTAARSTSRPLRFPVTRFEVEAPEGQGRADDGPPAVIVLDDCDPDYEESRPHHDGLHFLDGSGRELRAIREFSVSQTVAACHRIAIDRKRGRVYVCGDIHKRVTALDLRGRTLWRVDNISASALAVDPKTGNLWCSVGQSLDQGETVVLDAQGNEVASYPAHGFDLAYDPKTDAFWLVGYGITKLSRAGEVLFHKPREGWLFATIAVNPGDGSVWICEREHPDVPRSRNRVWHLDADGSVLPSETLGDEERCFGVACDPRTGTAYVALLRAAILRFAPDGRRLPPLPIPALAVSASPAGGPVWATTTTEILRLDDSGAVQSRTPFGADSSQSWLAAF